MVQVIFSELGQRYVERSYHFIHLLILVQNRYIERLPPRIRYVIEFAYSTPDRIQTFLDDARREGRLLTAQRPDNNEWISFFPFWPACGGQFFFGALGVSGAGISLSLLSRNCNYLARGGV